MATNRASVTPDDERSLVQLIERDVAARVPTDCDAVILEEARRLRGLCSGDYAQYRDRLVADVQQRLHDEFIDTTWPACPEHPNHPLWLVDGCWMCTASGRVVAPLGQLEG